MSCGGISSRVNDVLVVVKSWDADRDKFGVYAWVFVYDVESVSLSVGRIFSGVLRTNACKDGNFEFVLELVIKEESKLIS